MVWGLSILGNGRWDLDPLWYRKETVRAGNRQKQKCSVLRWTVIRTHTYSISKSWTIVYPATQQLHSQVQPWEKCIHIFKERQIVIAAPVIAAITRNYPNAHHQQNGQISGYVFIQWNSVYHCKWANCSSTQRNDDSHKVEWKKPDTKGYLL